MKKITFFATEPDKLTRLKLEIKSLRKVGFKISVCKPLTKTKIGGRLFSAFFRYSSYSLQELFTNSDIYHVMNVPDIAHISLILRKAKPLIYDYRSPWPERLKQYFHSGNIGKIGEKIEELFIKNSDVVITANRYLLKRALKEGAAEACIIPNYPPKSFKPSKTKNEWKKEKKVSENTKVALFVGRLTNTFDFPLLLKSWKMVETRCKNCELWIIGDGPLLPKIKHLIEKNKLKKVKIWGWRPYQEIPNWINASDACLAPIKKIQGTLNFYNEEGIWKISEYTAVNKPTLATNIKRDIGQCIIVKDDPNEFSEKLLKLLHGEINVNLKPVFWEDVSEPLLLKTYSRWL